MSEACRTCKENKEYKELARSYNQMVKIHNKMVDEHLNIREDANALMRLLEDICLGLKVYVTGQTANLCKLQNGYINIPEGIIWDPGKQFCMEMHNSIYELLNKMMLGLPPRDVYKEWMEKNKAIYTEINEIGG